LNKEQNPHIDLFRCFDVLTQKWFVILLVAGLAFCAATLATAKGRPSLYSASATLYSAHGSDVEPFQAQYSNEVMRGYTDVAMSRMVLDKAAKVLGLPHISSEDLREMISVRTTAASSIVEIIAVSEEPGVAITAVNAVANSFALGLNEITGKNMVRVLDVASTYVMVQNGGVFVWLLRLAAFFLAAVLASVWVLLADIASSKVRTLQEATLGGTLVILGMLPDYGVSGKVGRDE